MDVLRGHTNRYMTLPWDVDTTQYVGRLENISNKFIAGTLLAYVRNSIPLSGIPQSYHLRHLIPKLAKFRLFSHLYTTQALNCREPLVFGFLSFTPVQHYYPLVLLPSEMSMPQA